MISLLGIGVLLDLLSPAGAGAYSAQAYRGRSAGWPCRWCSAR